MSGKGQKRYTAVFTVAESVAKNTLFILVDENGIITIESILIEAMR